MTDPSKIIEQNLAVSRYLTDRPRRTMPWLVASGAIMPDGRSCCSGGI